MAEKTHPLSEADGTKSSVKQTSSHHKVDANDEGNVKLAILNLKFWRPRVDPTPCSNRLSLRKGQAEYR